MRLLLVDRSSTFHRSRFYRSPLLSLLRHAPSSFNRQSSRTRRITTLDSGPRGRKFRCRLGSHRIAEEAGWGRTVPLRFRLGLGLVFELELELEFLPRSDAGGLALRRVQRRAGRSDRVNAFPIQRRYPRQQGSRSPVCGLGSSPCRQSRLIRCSGDSRRDSPNRGRMFPSFA